MHDLGQVWLPFSFLLAGAEDVHAMEIRDSGESKRKKESGGEGKIRLRDMRERERERERETERQRQRESDSERLTWRVREIERVGREEERGG